MPDLSAQVSERFWAKVAQTDADTCWLWIGARTSDGYGHMVLKGRKLIKAHRLSYILHYDIDPGPLVVCHHCDEPACVNPAHLFIATQQANMDDMVAKRRHAYGERSARAKLSAAQVVEIRETYTGRYGQQAELARHYGVAPHTISRIVNNRRRVDG